MNNPDPQAIRAARQIEIPIAVIPQGRLIRMAIAHYNARLEPGRPPATTRSNRQFLQRLCVNWLRHIASHYDHVRDGVRASGGQQLSDTAGTAIKRRTLENIAAAYPWLAHEARRQASQLHRPGRNQA